MSTIDGAIDLTIPGLSGKPLNITVQTGESIFVMGANGTGKSTLIHRLNNEHHARARFIPAHRQTWMESNSVTMNSRDQEKTEQNIRQGTTRADARFRDNYSGARVSLSIAELLAAEAARDHDIAIAIDRGKPKRARKISRNRPSHLRTISSLLQSSGLPITISAHNGEELRAVKHGQEYSIEQLSDGERNAFLLAATILTTEQGTLFLLDEPERHLHRSISGRADFVAHCGASRLFVCNCHTRHYTSEQERGCQESFS